VGYQQYVFLQAFPLIKIWLPSSSRVIRKWRQIDSPSFKLKLSIIMWIPVLQHLPLPLIPPSKRKWEAMPKNQSHHVLLLSWTPVEGTLQFPSTCLACHGCHTYGKRWNYRNNLGHLANWALRCDLPSSCHTTFHQHQKFSQFSCDLACKKSISCKLCNLDASLICSSQIDTCIPAQSEVFYWRSSWNFSEFQRLECSMYFIKSHE